MTKYTETDIHHALEAIASGVSTKKASRDWGVPRATLYNRICGRECRKDAFSALQRLTKTQEKQLTEWILLQDALGLPPTHSQIRTIRATHAGREGRPYTTRKTLDAGFLEKKSSH